MLSAKIIGMSEPIISVENLSKRYLIEHSPRSQGHKRYTALRDVVAEKVGSFARNALAAAHGRQLSQSRQIEEFWALKNVNFEVRQGEVLGIIGRNGAGKSTLLKILSRITEPTAGRVTLRGRVASLLEVGTGFHPELTGRENIYLNGAILGMSRAEIHGKFDEIVAFAETEQFLDTPVKRYSSGMYVRLAFAVAAHLEPEILVVDEVLAVGDAEFQKKCLGKMDQVSRREGRTVLFVSHNLAAVETLCTRCILIASGELNASGSANEVVGLYLKEYRNVRARSIKISSGLMLARLEIMPPTIRTGDSVDVTIHFQAEDRGELRECAVLIYSLRGVRVAIKDLRETNILPLGYKRGDFALVVRIASLPLVEGEFTVGLWLVTDTSSGNFLDLQDFVVIAPPPVTQFVPYVPEYQGTTVLNASVSVVINQSKVMAL
jgi:lipopolysaccharide transport system ATP-binding protein